ncbi:MAG: TauD/TfdA family dioxygenase [Acidimicrobiia bacterium]
MRFEPLTVGVEVLDVDLSHPVAESDIEQLRAHYRDDHLLLFRGQHLSGDRQVEVLSWFGPVLAEKMGAYGYVSNVIEGAVVPEGGLSFHSDFAFTWHPIDGISLHAVAVPANGAPTRFADAVRVVDELPHDLRARLERARVLNVFDFGAPADGRMRAADLAPDSPSCIHDAIGTHRITGEPVVMAGEMHSDCVLGLAPDESEALLAELFAYLYAPTNVYEHRWAVGDLVLWDNLALQHGRPAFPDDEERTLQRVVLGTKSAAELVPNLGELLAVAKGRYS